MLPTITFQDVQAAAERIQDSIQRTPCPHSVPLSLATGCQIYCKLEYLSEVTIHCVVETRDAEHADRLRERLSTEGFLKRV